MPTFKADFAAYDKNQDQAHNLESFMEQYNALVQKLCLTINNLDEENFGAGILEQHNREEEDGEY
ncbi:MAG: hypothetical protein E7517_03345 [Ruminococcaceae bacterium]|nr:hypothetical protein [Oscillospiraceae bacterium]